jgi:hypothetical protein
LVEPLKWREGRLEERAHSTPTELQIYPEMMMRRRSVRAEGEDSRSFHRVGPVGTLYKLYEIVPSYSGVSASLSYLPNESDREHVELLEGEQHVTRE